MGKRKGRKGSIDRKKEKENRIVWPGKRKDVQDWKEIEMHKKERFE